MANPKISFILAAVTCSTTMADAPCRESGSTIAFGQLSVLFRSNDILICLR